MTTLATQPREAASPQKVILSTESVHVDREGRQWERVACAVCGRDEGREYHRERLAYFGEMIEFTIVRCERCGLVYTNPRLAEHNATYEQGSVDDEAVIESHAREKAKVFSRAIREIEGLLGREKANGLRLLDVGCGSGHFAGATREAGWQVIGLEPAGTPADYAERKFGFEVVRRDVLSAGFATESFDVITMWDVLEHVGDPRAVLSQCAGWLRRGGVLGCRFPSARWQKLKARVFGALGWERPVFSPTMHYYFFDEGPFSRLAKDAGLTVSKVRTTALEANTDNRFLNAVKIGLGPMLEAAGQAGLRIGNLEVYCRKG